jgi:hypothetical protein
MQLPGSNFGQGTSYRNEVFLIFFSVPPGKISTLSNRSRGSSVSIVSDYGLDDRAIGVRSPAGAKDFSSNLCVQIGSEAEAYPASCPKCIGGPFHGAKRGRGVTLTTHPHLVRRSRIYLLSPKRHHGV